ncbi:MAG TPA: hypothetical protein VNM14_17730 [Planctomycetota bacterium]|jgi:hypothetical protein|nr:hypothetical protein [Planctomycetota bacterium]
MTQELRFQIKGRALQFPDGKPFCLVCGATPAGVRRVWFEETGVDGASLVSRSHALGQGVQAIANRIEFDAPLCKEHRWRATLAGLAGIACFLLAAAVIGAGVMLGGDTTRRKAGTDWMKYISMGLCLIPGGFGYMFWKRKDRGGLRCSAHLDGDKLVLTWPDAAPKQLAKS